MKQKIFSGIYQIRNLVNDHSYVGQSANLKRRETRHFSELRNDKHDNIYLQRAFNKYGEENFKFEILLYCEIDQLTYYEQNFVNILNPEYNICRECVDSNKGTTWTDESKQKLSNSIKGEKNCNYGKKMSDEQRAKISLAKSGENNHNFGKHFSEDHRRKISEALLGENHPMYGKHLSDEQKKKQSDATKGEKNFMFGKHHSEETNKKISESKMGSKYSEETKARMRDSQKARREREMRNKNKDDE